MNLKKNYNGMNNLTIGWLKSVKITNGERIDAFDEVEAHKVAVSVKSKENLPVPRLIMKLDKNIANTKLLCHTQNKSILSSVN